MRAKRPVRLALACAAIALPAVLTAPGPVGASRPVSGGLQAVQPLPALPAGAASLGAIPASTRLSMRVVLTPRDPIALSRFIAAVSTPSSASFRHYLARGRFAARFGPTGTAVDAVRALLRGAGLAVTSLSPSHLVLSVSGAAGAFSTALHAPIARWRLPSGELGFRLGVAPRLPASIARYVAGVVGVSSLVKERSFATLRGQRRHLARPRAQAARSVRQRLSPSAPCPAASPLPSGTFSPFQEGQAYGLNTAWSHGYDGTGRTIAVEEFAPYASGDIVTYDHCFMLIPKGAKADPHVHNVLVDGGTSPGSAASSDEPTLDIEELRALAPGANVQAYLGPNNVTGPLDVLQRIATDDTAQAVSISWGICEAFSDHVDETPVFQQMAAQGQTVFAASGDSGSSDCIGQSPQTGAQLVAAAVDDPASQPLVTGVGGLTVDKLSPLSESVWNNCGGQPDNCFGSASGGGVSAVYARPAWQSAPGTPTGTSRGAHARLVPDLSVMGDPATGMLIYFGGNQGSYQGIGGTSMGAPLMAALDVVAAQSCGVTTLGFVNPLLYSMARHGGAFNDVTSGTNAIASQTSVAHEFDAGPGYDMASGLGSPKPTTFLPALCSGSATATASPPTPSAVGSLWEMTFHTGATSYPPRATVTVMAPPGTAFPASPTYWSVDSTAGSSPPSAVTLSKTPTSTTNNVAVLTPHNEPPAVDLVTIGAVVVHNPKAVGTASVVISDSVDHLTSTAPLALDAAVPSSTGSTVSVRAHHAIVGSVGVTVVAVVRDGAGNAVLGARVTAKATGHGRAIVLRTTTDASGTAAFSLRDDRVETSVVSVSAGGVHVGGASAVFTDPWRSHVLVASPRLGRVLGAPAVVATGRGDGWVALVRTTGGRLVAAIPRGARLDVALLARNVPLAAATPSLVRVGAWLYAAYRSTTGHLVVLHQGGGNHLAGWRFEDLTAARRTTTPLDDPGLVVAGHGASAQLSIAWVTRSRLVERTTASLRTPTRFTTFNLTDAASLPTSATGDVAEVRNGPSDAFVFTTTDGRVFMVARVPSTPTTRAPWASEDLASSALLDVSRGNAIVGSPTAVVSRFGFTIAAVTRNRRVDEFVGSFNNWSAEAIVSGTAGSSPPAGHTTLPALVGDPLVTARGAVTDLVLASTTGRIVELSSLTVADPWSSYDLTSLARVVRGGSTGFALLPERTPALLCAIGGRLVVVGAGPV